ncbi:MAG: sigma-70 family RNA polymerase sigma factor [Clostridiales bacterium]|nr:sigma-70 family RNA polymerase sigma factor [Clostridiales bacterium]
MTDNEIIELYWKRSEEAIFCTMREYGGYLIKLTMNILHIREEAEECVNESYLSAWNQIPPDRPAKLLPYLGRIARCLALNRYDYLNAQKRGTDFILQLSELEDCLSSGDTTQQQVDNHALSQAISAFLKNQDIESRNMFIRRYWYSDSVKEIAKRYGVRESKVKSQLFRLRGRLKNYLIEEGFSL